MQSDPYPTIAAIIGPYIPHRWFGTPVTPDTMLADLGLDEVDLDVIAMEVGDEFGCHIPEEMWRRWATVADVVRSVEGVHG